MSGVEAPVVTLLKSHHNDGWREDKGIRGWPAFAGLEIASWMPYDATGNPAEQAMNQGLLVCLWRKGCFRSQIVAVTDNGNGVNDP